MATADDYAKWIVSNASKEGTPEFKTVAQAYKAAKAEEEQTAAAPKTRPIVSYERGQSAAAPTPEVAAAAPSGEPETTLAGIGGAISRGITPGAVMAGAGALGAAALGVPVATGAALGAGALTAASMLGLDEPFVAKLEELMTRAGVPEPKTAIENIFKSAASMGTSAATGALAAKAIPAAAGTLGQAAKMMLGERVAEQAIAGVGAGAAAQAAGELGLSPAMQTLAGLGGSMVASHAARTRVVPAAQATQTERALVGEAERVGVPVMTSDVAPPRTFMGKAAQAAGERVPVLGTGPMREVQQTKRVQAVRDLASEYGATSAVEASGEVMADLIATRQKKLSDLTTAKNDVISRLSSAGELPVTRTVAAIDQQIAKLQALKTKELAPVVQRLEDWKQAIANQPIDRVEDLRKQIGESFKTPELANVRSTGEKALSSIYGALRQDMSDFIGANGQPKDLAKWQVANKSLASMMRELNAGALKSVLDKGADTPEVIGRMLFSEKPSEVKALVRNLSEKGKESAKQAIIARAVERATTAEQISADKFISQLEKHANQIGVTFTKDEQRRIAGLKRVLEATKRAAEAGVATPTGQQVVPAATALAAGQLTGSALGGAAALAGAGILARIYESKPVRNLLLALPKTKVGSPEEAALLKRIAQAVQAQQKIKQTPEEQPTP